MMVNLISLNRCYDRREFMINQFAAGGWNYRIQDAFDGNCIDQWSDLQLVDREAFLARYRREISSGEIGCYASHMAIFQDCLGLPDDPIIVMEDDVKINCLPSDLEALLTNAPPFDLLYLHRPFLNGFKFHKCEDERFHEVKITPCGTQFYAISKRMAAMILQKHYVCSSPIDELFWRLLKKGEIRALAAVNPLADHEMFQFPTQTLNR